MAEPIWYVCKYTPIEWLDGFGLPVQRLDPAPVSFECADTCAHPNLCGYGKAVLEEVIGKESSVFCLWIAVTYAAESTMYCGAGRMEFLFLMSLPHKNGHAECALLEWELQRLSLELSRLTGRSFNKKGADAGRKSSGGWKHVLQCAAHSSDRCAWWLLTVGNLAAERLTARHRRNLYRMPSPFHACSDKSECLEP